MASGIEGTSLWNDANLRHVYKGEDTADSKGSATLTNNNSVTFTAARFDNGFNLGASNSSKYMSVTTFNASENSFETALSISLWLKIITEPSGADYIVYLGDDVTNHIAYEMYYSDGGGVSNRVGINRRRENVANNGVEQVVDLGTADFHHFVMTYDGTNLSGYIDNGTPFSTTQSGTGNAGGETDGFLIGRNRLSSSEASVSAIIDDVALFDRELSAAEVEILFESPLDLGGGVARGFLRGRGNFWGF